MEQTDSFIVAVSALIVKDDRFLAMKRSPEKKAGPNLWETLSGRVEHGEDPYDAIKREILEECGLSVEVERRPIDVYMSRRLGLPMLLIAYEAKYLSGEVTLSEEHSEFRWVTLSEFKSLTTLKRLVESIEKFSSLKSEVPL